MSQIMCHTQIYLRNWKLLLFSFFPPVLLSFPVIMAAAAINRIHLGFTLLATGSLVCGTAFFLASSQQEMMSRAFSFLMPGLRHGMIRIHALAGLVAVLVVLASVFVLPPYQDFSGSLLTLAWSISCLVVVLFGLTLIVTFASPFSSWLPFNAIWTTFIFIKLFVNVSEESIFRFLDHPEIWTPLAVLIIWGVYRRLKSPALHRRLIEEPYISIVDLKNQTKIEEFKQARARKKGNLQKGNRPGHRLIRNYLDRLARAASSGHHSMAVAWGAIGAMLLTSIPRSRARGLFLLFMLLFLVIFMGYFDSWYMLGRKDDTAMTGWFPAMAFMMAYSLTTSFHFVKTRPLGLLRARSDLYRAGWQAMGLIFLQTALFSALVWTMFLVGSWIAPDLTVLGRDISFSLPRPHTPFLPLASLPIQLLVYILWPMKGSQMVLQQAGTLTFFLLHGLLNFGGYNLMLLPVLGLVLACALAVVFAWHWRVWKTDLA